MHTTHMHGAAGEHQNIIYSLEFAVGIVAPPNREQNINIYYQLYLHARDLWLRLFAATLHSGSSWMKERRIDNAAT